MSEGKILECASDLSGTASILHQHSNENLLKIDTYDTYSTVNAIKKKIAKDLERSPPVEPSSSAVIPSGRNNTPTSSASRSGQTTRSGALFAGQLRMHKNPKNSYLYIAFDTPEHREAALQQLITIPGRKGAPWKEAPVVAQDLRVTYKGQTNRKRGRESGGKGVGGGQSSSSSTNRQNNNNNSNNNAMKVVGFAHFNKTEQLDRKKTHCLKVMKRILPSNVYGWDTYIKRFDGIRESPEWKGYRNHVQLSFGKTKDGVPSVGFWAGALVDGYNYIMSVINENANDDNDGSDSVRVMEKEESKGEMVVPSSSPPPMKEEKVVETSKAEEEEGRGSLMDGECKATVRTMEGTDEELLESTLATSTTTTITSSPVPPCLQTEKDVEEAPPQPQPQEEDVKPEEEEEEDAVAITMNPIAREVAAAVMGVAKEFFATEGESAGEEEQTVDSYQPPPPQGKNVDEGGSPVATPSHSSFRRPLTVLDKQTGEGFWRKLQIRHNIFGEVMVDLECGMKEIDQPDGADHEDRLVFQEVMQRLVEVLTGPALQEKLQRVWQRSHPSIPNATAARDGGEETPSPRVVSIQYHLHTGLGTSPTDAPRHLLAGEPQLIEHVVSSTCPPLFFAIGPTTFFQVNTPALSVMLEEIVQAAALHPQRTTLLDLCSGVGTLGICLAHRVRRVIGIEIVEQAVLHARENVQRNHLSNAVYHTGRVEQLLPRVVSGLTTAEREDLVVILDPPRAGVNSTVLKWIRGTPRIRTVVYISCDQRALEQNCPFLTKPPTKAYRGTPFEVVKGFGIDMFPHTPHVEMVVVLRRPEDKKEEKQEES